MCQNQTVLIKEWQIERYENKETCSDCKVIAMYVEQDITANVPLFEE